MLNKEDPRTTRLKQQYLGKHFFTTDGKIEYYVSEANSYADATITFIPSNITKHIKIGDIKRGITNPFAVKCHPELVKPFIFQTPQQEYEGIRYKTNEGYIIQIMKYESYNKVYYQFLDEFGYIGSTTLQNIKKGEIKNPYARNSVGGYMSGKGPYSGNEYEWVRNTWYLMLNRISGKRKEYKLNATSYINADVYENVAIYPAWYNYTFFANWYMENYNRLNHTDVELQVDKDLLYPYYSQFTRGRKCYSPFTCTLLPKSINTSIANIKTAQTVEVLNRNIEPALQNNYIDHDTYCVIKRFYIKDPEYSDYVTTRFDSMRMNLCGL